MTERSSANVFVEKVFCCHGRYSHGGELLENLNKTNHGGEGKDEQCFFEVVKDLTKPGELFRRLKTQAREGDRRTLGFLQR